MAFRPSCDRIPGCRGGPKEALLFGNIRNKAALLEGQEHLHQVIHKLGKQPARARKQLRGCPMCWTVGLVETLSQGLRDSTAERADRTWLH